MMLVVKLDGGVRKFVQAGAAGTPVTLAQLADSVAAGEGDDPDLNMNSSS
jgi:hypothetical protein